MVPQHQSGLAYLPVIGILFGIGFIIWCLGKLFPRKAHSAIGNALMQVETLLRPSREHVLEAKQYERKEEDGDSAPPRSGSVE